MNLIRISLIITTLFLSFSINAAELSDFEKQQIANEFNNYFKSTDSGSMQTLNKNPWAGKRARQNERTKKILQVSATLGNCKQYSLKQRRQCFVNGNNPASCELSYKARLDHCNRNF
ncbi:MAG: hypothetical protein OQK98_02495 [Gammaproteobacteria bacterium]|nr:hypothetical protein [Gammaproteobacteria bacterium]